MNDVRENQFGMFLRVKSHLTDNLGIYGTIPGFTMGIWPEFLTIIENIFTHNVIVDLDITGAAEDKANKRQTLIEAMTIMYNGLAAYGALNNKPLLLRKVDFSASEINKKRDTAVATAAITLANIPNEIDDAPALIPFGVTSAAINALNTATNDFLSIIDSPQEQSDQRSQAIIEMDILFDRMMKLLTLKVDYVNGAVLVNHPTVHGLYLHARAIHDTGAINPPDFTGTVAPGEILHIISHPYDEGRSFRMKNEGEDVIKFGLAEDMLTIIAPGVVVNANSQSTRLSSSLATMGDNLLVQNEGATAAVYSVWVTEA